ncbi:MAG: M28 family peptidase, partial [Nitrospiraceae bacterium]
LLPLTEEERTLERELRSHVAMLAGDIGERNLFHYDKLLTAAEYIRVTLSRSGYEVRAQAYEVSGKVSENLEAEVLGRKRPDEILVIGAHYDSVMGSPGANDNATGVAALLALARAFSDRQPSRTLRFLAFVNEEPPLFQTRLMGSWVYAKRSRQRGEKIVAMLSLETIGYYSDEPGSQSYPFPFNLVYPSTANFIAFVGNVKAGSLVQQVVGGFRRHARFPSEGGALLGFIPGVGWSDHWAFWREGFPAMMVTDTALFRYPAYHSSSDTPEKVQYGHMARVLSGLEQVIRELANPLSDGSLKKTGR